MGLDITAYEKVIPLGRHVEGWCEDEGHRSVFVYKGFEQSGRGLHLDGEIKAGGSKTAGGTA
jgi:hypothetical protein